MNWGLLGKGNASHAEALREQVEAGACGLKVHEDWGTTPAVIDARVARGRRVRCAGGDPHRHAERGGLRRRHRSPRSLGARSTPTTPRAPAAATRPTSSRSPRMPNVLPSSTNPTRPYTVNTLAEHLDMLMVCHHLNPRHRRRCRLRRQPHSARDDRGGGCAARPGRDLMYSSRLAGHGPRRREFHARDPDGRQDARTARQAARETAPATTTSASCATWPS